MLKFAPAGIMKELALLWRAFLAICVGAAGRPLRPATIGRIAK